MAAGAVRKKRAGRRKAKLILFGIELIVIIVMLVVLYLVQLTGALRLNALVLAVVALGLAIADVVLFNAASRGFTPERLLREEGDGPSN